MLQWSNTALKKSTPKKHLLIRHNTKRENLQNVQAALFHTIKWVVVGCIGLYILQFNNEAQTLRCSKRYKKKHHVSIQNDNK